MSVDAHRDPKSREQTPARRAAMQTNLIGLKGDHEALDREYFRALLPGEKMAMVSSIFTEQWLLKGGDAKQLRLRRDIACLQRGKR
jgi:hypothetical protein